MVTINNFISVWGHACIHCGSVNNVKLFTMGTFPHIHTYIQAEDTGLKLESIKAAVVDSIRELCQSCGITGDRIANEVFQCFPASPEAVTYRAKLHGTTSTNSNQLISQIEQWTSQGAAINIQQVLLRVDGSCRVAVSALVDDECLKRNVRSDSSSGNTNIISISVGGVLAAVIIVVVIIVIVIVTVTVCVRRNKHQER
jgi:hypothetical protein